MLSRPVRTPGRKVKKLYFWLLMTFRGYRWSLFSGCPNQTVRGLGSPPPQHLSHSLHLWERHTHTVKATPTPPRPRPHRQGHAHTARPPRPCPPRTSLSKASSLGQNHSPTWGFTLQWAGKTELRHLRSQLQSKSKMLCPQAQII